jgi:hypothetical protein
MAASDAEVIQDVRETLALLIRALQGLDAGLGQQFPMEADRPVLTVRPGGCRTSKRKKRSKLEVV